MNDNPCEPLLSSPVAKEESDALTSALAPVLSIKIPALLSCKSFPSPAHASRPVFKLITRLGTIYIGLSERTPFFYLPQFSRQDRRGSFPSPFEIFQNISYI